MSRPGNPNTPNVFPSWLSTSNLARMKRPPQTSPCKKVNRLVKWTWDLLSACWRCPITGQRGGRGSKTKKNRILTATEEISKTFPKFQKMKSSILLTDIIPHLPQPEKQLSSRLFILPAPNIELILLWRSKMQTLIQTTPIMASSLAIYPSFSNVNSSPKMPTNVTKETACVQTPITAFIITKLAKYASS